MYSDDPNIIGYHDDGTPRYKIPEGSYLVGEDGEPMIVDIRQDGTPVYSDDPNIIGYHEDGTPRYKIPEGSYLVYDNYEED